MKWKVSMIAVILFVLLALPVSAQTGAGVAVAVGLGEMLIGGAIVAYDYAVPLPEPPISLAQEMAERRAAYEATLPAEHHAVQKHGAEANQAYAETADVSNPSVTKYHCKDGRDRTVNWSTGAIRVEENGQPVTAFRYDNRDYLKHALLRDGCIEAPPTPHNGHDDVRQIPTWPATMMAPVSTGPAKVGTPIAYQIIMQRAQARRRGE